MKQLAVGRREWIGFGLAYCLVLLASVAAAGGQTPAKPATDDAAPATFAPEDATPKQLINEAWSTLTTAVQDAKHTDRQQQALAALGTMGGDTRAIGMIVNALGEGDVDVRTAAVLAAGQTKSNRVTTPLRNLLDDREPQVVFAAATTLWKMNDRSGEDILMAVADGERHAGPSLINGTKHTVTNDLHHPETLAKMGAMQGAGMLLGPFGFGITAYEYLRKSGGDTARVTAIEQLAQNHTDPIRKELTSALGDKDETVRAAAAKALGDYHDVQVQKALAELFIDARLPVRLTASAAYLKSRNAPGPGSTQKKSRM